MPADTERWRTMEPERAPVMPHLAEGFQDYGSARMMGDGQVPVGLSAVIHALQHMKDTKTQVCVIGRGSLVRAGYRC
jgi:hypothetical protein